eukprot:TRINITY_DN20119_c0_g1_i2.p1 TRINITY_DN20119_c0_g1~~TRINITY_DN20119_c0_g1_i2.p1  ORF type:complete len:587 (-),score=56.82 TRINITY_DN20119_c0_g1_i2:327-2087(-)
MSKYNSNPAMSFVNLDDYDHPADLHADLHSTVGEDDLPGLIKNLFDWQVREIRVMHSQHASVLDEMYTMLKEHKTAPLHTNVLAASRRASEPVPQPPTIGSPRSLSSISKPQKITKGLGMNSFFEDMSTTSISTKKSRRRTTQKLERQLVRVIKSRTFDHFVAVLLVAYAAFMGIQVELMFVLDGGSSAAVELIDQIFGGLFIVELVLRLYAFGCKSFFWFSSDRWWNLFDTVVVSFSTLDTAVSLILASEASALGNLTVLRIVRITRLTRVFRIIRVMKIFKELRVMISAIFSTLKTATWAMILVAMTMYIFGVGLAQLSASYFLELASSAREMPEDQELLDQLHIFYGSLPVSIMTLFMAICDGIDWEVAYRPLYLVDPFARAIFLVYVTFSSFCLMNVIVGIFCQNAVEAFEQDREKLIEMQMNEKNRYVDMLTTLFMSHAGSEDNRLNHEEFVLLVQDPEMRALLTAIDIEVRDAVTLFKMVSSDSDGPGTLDIDEFITGCIALRGGAKAFHLERAYVETKKLTRKIDRVLQVVGNGMPNDDKHRPRAPETKIVQPPRDHLIPLCASELNLHPFAPALPNEQ